MLGSGIDFGNAISPQYITDIHWPLSAVSPLPVQAPLQLFVRPLWLCLTGRSVAGAGGGNQLIELYAARLALQLDARHVPGSYKDFNAVIKRNPTISVEHSAFWRTETTIG